MENQQLKDLISKKNKLKAEMETKVSSLGNLGNNPMAVMGKVGEFGAILELFKQKSDIDDQLIFELVKRSATSGELPQKA